MDTPFVLTISETCNALKLSRSKVYQLIKAGDLKVIKFGKATRLSVVSVQDLAEQGAPANKREHGCVKREERPTNARFPENG